ncbi:MAG: hypothetical protein J6S67_13095 [Methanobrevibacter sp.]|nr:hypothetical protein [Methanobrevibacter sp.]
MTKKELERIRGQYLAEHHKYKMMHWEDFDYKILSNIMYTKKTGGRDNRSYSDAIIMADTETSKKYKTKQYHNHVCAWTISIRAFDMNIVTLYGHKPTTFVTCLSRIRKALQGDFMVVYFHNLPYDWPFLELFLMEEYGRPHQQLNIKSHYPLFITFDNGIQLRDSLILAQRSLEKWAEDMHVEHQKAVGLWEYDKIRNQDETFSQDELEYIEHDTLAGVECIQKTMDALGKKILTMPYTSTGIVREEVRKLGKLNCARQLFEKIAPTFAQYSKLEKLYHGGYTHGNRHLIDELLKGLIECYDFASSYPFVMLSEKFPMEKFTPFKDCKLKTILDNDSHAFMFKLILYKPRLKDDFIPMPVLQVSKCVQGTLINPVQDNGRIICADYLEVYTNEIDASIIADQYDWDGDLCVEVEKAYKDYLPRWFTDYIFELFRLKCALKNGDPVLYALAKARLNSMYGLCCQHSIKETIEENYLTGEFKVTDNSDPEAEYEKYLNNKNNILPYFWGCWVTSYAMKNLFELGKCVKEDGPISHWIYSDTDSIYSDLWDKEKIAAYNEKAKKKLQANNYGAVIIDAKEYWLGIAEHDDMKDTYTEFKVQGAKRYCGRKVKDGKLHITVAGVPKKGAVCLRNNIKNFKKGMKFRGKVTGKNEHRYFYVDKIYTDRHGNLTGHSIDLSPCDYLLDNVSIEDPDWMDRFMTEDISIQIYDEGGIY